MEYDNHRSPSIYVAFRTTSDLSNKWDFLKGKSVDLVIWTTTPWTLPANLAICVHPKFEYVFYDLGTRVAVVAEDLLVRFLQAVAANHLRRESSLPQRPSLQRPVFGRPTRILGFAEGASLAGLQYRHPFLARTSPVILGEHVTLEQGTGLVHTALATARKTLKWACNTDWTSTTP